MTQAEFRCESGCLKDHNQVSARIRDLLFRDLLAQLLQHSIEPRLSHAVKLHYKLLALVACQQVSGALEHCLEKRLSFILTRCGRQSQLRQHGAFRPVSHRLDDVGNQLAFGFKVHDLLRRHGLADFHSLRQRLDLRLVFL